MSITPVPKRLKPDVTPTSETVPSTRNIDGTDSDATPQESARRWTSATTYGPTSSGDRWQQNPGQFAGSSTGASLGSRPPITTVQASRTHSAAQQEAMAALRFVPRAYVAGTASQPWPGAVLVSLANQLAQLLHDAGEPIEPASQARVGSVLAAMATYADALGQPGMKKCLDSMSWADAPGLDMLAQCLSTLGSRMPTPSNDDREAVQAPDLALLLDSYRERILGARSGPQQELHCRALACLVASTASDEQAPLLQACADYFGGAAPLQNVVDALGDAIKGLGRQDLLKPSSSVLPLSRFEQADVHDNLEIACGQLQGAPAGPHWVEQATNLGDWLRRSYRPDRPLEPLLWDLLQRCDACRASNGSAGTAEAMYDALRECFSAASDARRGQAAVTLHRTEQADPAQLERQAAEYAASIKAAGSRHSEERLTDAVHACLSRPTATSLTLTTTSNLPVSTVSETRAALRDYVACNVPDGKLLGLMFAALGSADEDTYRRRTSHSLGERLVNPLALPLWKKMAQDYEAEFPHASLSFHDLVRRRHYSLLRFIPDQPLAGVLYATLYATDPNYCKPVAEARRDFMRARAVAGLATTT